MLPWPKVHLTVTIETVIWQLVSWALARPPWLWVHIQRYLMLSLWKLSREFFGRIFLVRDCFWNVQRDMQKDKKKIITVEIYEICILLKAVAFPVLTRLSVLCSKEDKQTKLKSKGIKTRVQAFRLHERGAPLEITHLLNLMAKHLKLVYLMRYTKIARYWKIMCTQKRISKSE